MPPVLVSCPACKSEVSATAPRCMKCGHAINTPRRGIFGTIFKWTFIGFNLLMLAWMVGGVGAASKHVASAHTQAEQAGAAVGTALGASIILAIWVAGSILLGLFVLFTRPKA